MEIPAGTFAGWASQGKGVLKTNSRGDFDSVNSTSSRHIVTHKPFLVRPIYKQTWVFLRVSNKPPLRICHLEDILANYQRAHGSTGASKTKLESSSTRYSRS